VGLGFAVLSIGDDLKSFKLASFEGAGQKNQTRFLGSGCCVVDWR
jgi:hypothetical protein